MPDLFGQSGRRYERGFQEISVNPLVLPSLEKGIYGAKVGDLDS
jgi:hypothetical protein